MSSGLLWWDGCARSLCGGIDLVLSDLGESLMHHAPGCRDRWKVWKAVPKEGNRDHQEGEKSRRESVFLFGCMCVGVVLEKLKCYL